MANASTLLDYSEYVSKAARGFSGRDWLFRALNAWLLDPAAGRTFLVTGEPGSGRTAFAAQLVQFAIGNVVPPQDLTALSKGFIHAMHFCRADDPLTVDPLAFVRSISLQLARRFPQFQQALLARNSGQAYSVTQHTGQVAPGGSVIGIMLELNVGDQDPWGAFNRLLYEPLRDFLAVDDSRSVVVLIDGID